MAILEGRKTQTRRVIKPQPVCRLHCPYGVPGDRLWVRETLEVVANWGTIEYAADQVLLYDPYDVKAGFPYAAEADAIVERWGDSYHCNEAKGVPSIFMPRWASRITLELTDVRVQWLQDISGSDVLAEGIDNGASNPTMGARWENMQRMAFETLWDSINAKRSYSWEENPWVWALTFRRIQP